VQRSLIPNYVHTGKLERFPRDRDGAESWDYLRHFGRDTMMRESVIGSEDVELIRRADSPAMAVPIIRGA